MKTCKDCPKRSTCTELCKEAEQIASQDHIVESALVYTQGSGALDYIRDKSGMDVADMERDMALGPEEMAIIGECGLTARQYDCIDLRYFHGMTFRDIGAFLNISAPVVLQHINYAKKKIKAYLTNPL